MPISIPLPIAKGGTGQAATGINAFSAGINNTASGEGALAIGYENTSSVEYSTAVGSSNVANNDKDVAIGYLNEAVGGVSVAIGILNKATAAESLSLGYQNWAYGSRSSAFGYGCYGGGTNSSAFGYFAKTTVANTSEFGYWSGPSTRNGAIRTDSTGVAAVTYSTSSTQLTDGGATAGNEAVGTIPRGMVALRVTSNELFADYNISGSVSSNLLAREGSTELGYSGTGTGGTVTQLTSKSTSVTLDKLCGQITMNNASLAQNTTVSFTLNNTNIHSTDVIIVNIGSGATANAYTAFVEAVNTGSCRIHLRNSSSGSLSEAVVLNFAVIKAVNA
jgi:hypothetical protein